MLAFVLGLMVGLAVPWILNFAQGIVIERRGDYIDGWMTRERRQMMEKENTH